MNLVTPETLLYFQFEQCTPELQWDDDCDQDIEDEKWRAVYRIQADGRVEVCWFEVQVQRLTGQTYWSRMHPGDNVKYRINVALQKRYDKQRAERLYGDAA